VVLWVVGWLYRDSLEIQNHGEKYVFVTGCDSGFGNLLCRKLDGKGFRVLAGCLTEKGADELRRTAGPRLKTVLLNVTNQDSIQKAMEWTKKEVGDKGGIRIFVKTLFVIKHDYQLKKKCISLGIQQQYLILMETVEQLVASQSIFIDSQCCVFNSRYLEDIHLGIAIAARLQHRCYPCLKP